MREGRGFDRGDPPLATGKEKQMAVRLLVCGGRAAGPIRHQRMLDEGMPDLVLALPGGRGTADMVRHATLAGVEVIEVGAAAI